MASASNTNLTISRDSMNSILTHTSLIQHFHTSLPIFSPFITTPIRQSYPVSPSSSLLLMPSWSSSSSSSFPFIGTKLVTHFPQNSAMNLPGIHGSYVLFSSITGQTLASMDGTLLTLYRTSSISGLASKILARDDSQVLIMVGAGALAPHLIKSHLSAKPNLRRVIVWNRNPQKAKELVESFRAADGFDEVSFESNESLDEIVPLGDIISCATNSENPLVNGEKLKPGAHLDLVGSFRPSMRECDDEAIRRGKLFVDNDDAIVEAGELVGALGRGIIEKKDICGNLIELIKGEKEGRKKSEEITVFKSVGSAMVDLLAAQLVFQTYVEAFSN